MLVVGSDKHSEGHRRWTDRLDHLQTVQLGHLHIEKHQIQRLASNDLHRCRPIGRFENGADLRIFFKQIREALARRRFIIHHQNLHSFRGRRH